MTRNPAAERIRLIRELLHARLHADFDQIRYHLDLLEAEIDGCTCRHHDHRPAHIHLHAHLEGQSAMSDQIPAGHSVRITAAVTNVEGTAVPDQLTYSATAGTVTADDATTLTATLVNAPLGTVTVTATDSNGLTGSVTFDVVDPTPNAITLTAAAI